MKRSIVFKSVSADGDLNLSLDGAGMDIDDIVDAIRCELIKHACDEEDSCCNCCEQEELHGLEMAYEDWMEFLEENSSDPVDRYKFEFFLSEADHDVMYCMYCTWIDLFDMGVDRCHEDEITMEAIEQAITWYFKRIAE